ncbi:hypothetical protein V7166_17795 [Bacillus thuringiensis]
MSNGLEKKEELYRGLLERLKSDETIMVGSLSQFNLSNVNTIRQLHIISAYMNS